jgi:hypothetical protein
MYIQYSSSIVDSKPTVEDFDQEPDLLVFCSFVDPDSGSAWILVSRILTEVVKNDPQKVIRYARVYMYGMYLVRGTYRTTGTTFFGKKDANFLV